MSCNPRGSGHFDAFLDRTEAFYREAAGVDLPPFLTHPADSTPLNATPYLVRYAVFRETAKAWTGRERFVVELDALIEIAERQNLSIEAILIGGSFTELNKPTIGDIDCLLFYRLRVQDEGAGLAELSSIQRNAKTRGIDARFIPLDGDPLALIKLTSYFTILYSKHKNTHEIVRCLLLLDCRQAL